MKDKLSVIERAKQCIGLLTPLKGHDCGQLCQAACCRGDDSTGMLLFPGENTVLSVTELQNGDRLAVCDGSCDREQRPLACMLFPFFPTVDEEGKVYGEIDARAYSVCPLAVHCDEVAFDPAFIRAVKKAGRILSEDEDCLRFMQRITSQIDELEQLRESIMPDD